MSVLLLSEKEISKITNTLTSNDKILSTVKGLKIAEERSQFESPADVLARAIWYGYIANVTAFNVQYRENININFEMEETDETFDSLDEAISTLGSLLYNIATNDGNIFLEEKWSNVLDILYKIYESIKKQMEEEIDEK